MYRFLKNLVKKLVPKRMLFQFETTIRPVVYLFYRGSKFTCTICHKNIRRFMQTEDGDKLCPYCGSLSRTRRLWQLLQTDYLTKDISILDFSPSRSLFRAMKQNKDVRYASTDLSGDFISDYHYDITKIDVADNSFDLIICYHVLEHIEEDNSAIKELHRILKKDGICLIQTPFKEGNIYEDSQFTTEKERLEQFGQKDHVRIYSVDGLKERLENGGFRVQVKHYTDTAENLHGFSTSEYVLLCRK